MVLGPLELLEAEGLRVAALGTWNMEAVLAPGEKLRPDRAGLDRRRAGKAGLRDAGVEIQACHGELEGGGLEGGVVGPLVYLIGEEVTDCATCQIPLGTGTDQLQRACAEVHFGLAEIVVV